MYQRLRFWLNRLGERLWVKPLLTCLLSLIWVWLAGWADAYAVPAHLPEISFNSLESLLEILSASMLVIATLAVASMVSAYASATNTATPRVFKLVVADDTSQHALSTFVGAFIFSIVALVVLLNDYYQANGRAVLMLLTLLVFAYVIVTFVRWVDSIARLGRIGTTLAQVEQATLKAVQVHRQRPALGGVTELDTPPGPHLALSSSVVGYVQLVDMEALQACAQEHDFTIQVLTPPGCFVQPGQTVLLLCGCQQLDETIRHALLSALKIGEQRTFDDDPGFGLQVLSEVASRALSPAINDPGTALDVLGAYARVFNEWQQPEMTQKDAEAVIFDRIAVPAIDFDELLAVALRPLIRDGASYIEVMERLQQMLAALADLNPGLRPVATCYASQALRRALQASSDSYETEQLHVAASWLNKSDKAGRV